MLYTNSDFEETES